jgi:hypothetical protein
MGLNFEARLSQIRERIRSGEMKAAQELLRKTPIRSLPRKLRAPFAFAAREALLPHRAIETLASVVRPRKGGKSDATAQERLDYAFSLTGLGLTVEARALLEQFDLRTNIDAAHGMIVALGRDMEYEGIPPIVDPIVAQMQTHPKLKSPFLRAAFRLHGAGALVYGFGRHKDGRAWLDENLRELGTKEFFLIRHDTTLMKAASYCLERDFDRGLRNLEMAEAVFDGKLTPLLQRRVSQWRLIAELGRQPKPAVRRTLRAELDALRDWFLANARPHFARSCEFFSAMVIEDEPRLLRLHFASSNPFVRRRTGEKLSELGVRIPERLAVPLPGSLKGEGECLDLLAPGALGLKPDQLSFRLLHALTSDLLLRPNGPQLFALAFPGEYYDPWSSPSRVATGLARLRKQLRGSPLRVREEEGYYWLSTDGSSASVLLRQPRAESAPEREGFWLENVRAAFGARAFSAGEFAARFELSERTAQLRLVDACSEGWLAREGRARATRYRLCI